MVCLVVVKSGPKFRLVPFNVYLMALSVTDLCLALTCLPVYVMSTSKFQHPSGNAGSVFCKIISGYLLPFWLAGASIYILVIISFERYEAVSRPFCHRTRRAKVRTCLGIAFAWFMGLLIQMPTIIGEQYASNHVYATVGNYCMFTWKNPTVITGIYALTFGLNYVMPALILTMNFYRTKKCIDKLDESLQRSFADKRYHDAILTKKRKSVRIVFVVTLAFFVCWTPNNVMYFLFQYWDQKDIAWNSNVFQIGIILGFFSSCINPLLYAFQSKDFRKNCATIIRKIFGLTNGYQAQGTSRGR